MDRLDFAMSLIRAPLWSRLSDRTFLGTIGTALAAIGATVAAWQTVGLPVQDKANITIAAIVAVGGVVSAWNHGEKKKDATIAAAALSAPNVQNAGEVNITPSTPAAAATAITTADTTSATEVIDANNAG